MSKDKEIKVKGIGDNRPSNSVQSDILKRMLPPTASPLPLFLLTIVGDC